MKFLVALASCLVLSSCVIVTDRDDFYDSNKNWRQLEEQNRELISKLHLGSGVDEVRQILGGAEYSESFGGKDGQYLILRYRTQHKHSDGETTFDETTPLVFRDSRLIGWGETVLSSVL